MQLHSLKTCPAPALLVQVLKSNNWRPEQVREGTQRPLSLPPSGLQILTCPWSVLEAGSMDGCGSWQVCSEAPILEGQPGWLGDCVLGTDGTRGKTERNYGSSS